jgi:hypothetical protein
MASIEKERQVYMLMGNAFSNCNGSSSFSSRDAGIRINVIIWHKELIVRFEMSLRAEPHLYASLASVY